MSWVLKSGSGCLVSLDMLYCERSVTGSRQLVVQTDVGSPQAEMSEDAVRCKPAVTLQQGAAESSAHSAKRKPVSTLRGTGSKTAVGRGSRTQTAARVVRVDSGRWI